MTTMHLISSLCLLWAFLFPLNFLKAGVSAIPTPPESPLNGAKTRSGHPGCTGLRIVLDSGIHPAAYTEADKLVNEHWSLFVSHSYGYQLQRGQTTAARIMTTNKKGEIVPQILSPKNRPVIGHISFKSLDARKHVLEVTLPGIEGLTKLLWINNALEKLKELFRLGDEVTHLELDETLWHTAFWGMIKANGTADGSSVIGTEAGKLYTKLEEEEFERQHLLSLDLTTKDIQDIVDGKLVVIHE
ncbi:hypothetical protein C8R41DRAFT_134183 [Lentinula lateritia]|uniref:Uncharacterized protein n=1 Tax=Lentinula lateritia TaxID=40482 RepID=A0ABQ8UWL3_9AGAR|nr:hypothetical protein C8R41DRAFT_134183 [Lentinula lateritia]